MSNEPVSRERTAYQVDTGDQWGHEEEQSGAPVLELDGVTREFGHETAVRDLSLSVYEGELLTLLGPSGCGKTTTLRMLAGLERPSSGTVTIVGERVAGPETFVEPDRRDVGLVFQDYALFPHMTAGENVAFGLTDADESEQEARVTELLEHVLTLPRRYRSEALRVLGGPTYWGDNAKAERDLGLEHRPFEEGLRETLEYEQAHLSG